MILNSAKVLSRTLTKYMRYSGANRDVISPKFGEIVERLSCRTKIRKRMGGGYKTVVRKFK
jgi:hypothetical protein